MKQYSDTTSPIDMGRLPVPREALSLELDVEGMNCASCVAHVEKAARSLPGVTECRVNLATGRASVQFDPAQTGAESIAKAITGSGYTATPRDSDAVDGDAEQRRQQRQSREAQAWFYRAAAGVILWLPLEVIHWIMQVIGGHASHMAAAQSTWMGWATLITSGIAIVYVGGRFYTSALAALRNGTSNMDTLISMGASVAFGYSLVYFVGGLAGVFPPPMLHDLYFMEATGLLALISLGHWLEAKARQSAGSAIRQLLELAPATALRLSGEDAPTPKRTSLNLRVLQTDAPAPLSSTPIEVPVASLDVGDRVIIRPGDRVPIDGVVVDGESSIDESMITGEPIPVSRKPGDAVIGGTINQDGRLTIRVTKTGNQTALAQIVALVENAQSTKPPVQKLADQISAVFVPTVLGIALLTAIGWFLWGHGHGWPAGQIGAQVAKAVCSVLIIACPCALGLAVPATVMVGTGLGARRGILIRDIDAIQNAEKIDTIVLDKTGTVTQGKPAVTEIIPDGDFGADELLRLAASAEQFSSHPLARAIVAHARSRGVKLADVSGFKNHAGGGVIAEIEGVSVLVGNDAFLTEQGITAEGTTLASEGRQECLPHQDFAKPGDGTVVRVAKKMGDRGERVGTILIADQLKPDSIAAIAQLKEMGLKVVLLTGDNRAAAESVAKMVGITDVRAEVKPGDKAAVIAELIGTPRHSYIAMVGDGINDAPALARADLGIAVGGGSDIAKEAGDIVLVSGSLTGVAAAIRLSRATMRKIRQNLFLAFIYNVIAIPLAAFGLLSPLIAAAAMAMSDVTVIGNALSLRRENDDKVKR